MNNWKDMENGGTCESMSSKHSPGVGGEGRQLTQRNWDDESASLTEGRKDLTSDAGWKEGTELKQGECMVSERLHLL